MTFQAISIGMTGYLFGLWVVPWSEEFQVSRADIMIGYTIMNGVAGFLAPFAGHAMDHRSIRALVSTGIVALAGGLLLVSFSDSIELVLGLYATVIAIGTLLAGPLAASSLAAKWFGARRGLAIGLSTAGTSVGGLLLPPLAAFLLVAFGWRTSHQILAALAVIIVIPPLWLIVANRPEDRRVIPEPESRPSGEGPGPVAVVHPEWTTKSILRERNFWVIAIGFGLMSMAFGGIMPNLIPYAHDVGIDAKRGAALVSILAGTGILGKILVGIAADRIDLKRLFWLTAAVLSTPLILLIGEASFAVLVLASILLGLASGGFLPLMGAIIGSSFGPKAFGRAMGLLGPFLQPLALIGPPLAAWIYDTRGSYSAAFELFLIALVAAAGIMIFLRRAPFRASSASSPAIAE